MNKQTFKIQGMHCRSCELILEEKLKEISGVKNLQISLKNKEAILFSKNGLDESIVEKKIKEAGYEIGHEAEKSLYTRDKEIYKDFFLSLIILAILFFWGKIFDLDKITSLVSGDPSSLSVVFLVGLTAGISTCMALVGGLVLSISAKHAEKHPTASSAQKFRPHLYFNLGRIISYFILGGIVGLIGQAFALSGSVLGTFTIAVGIIMIILGVQLTDLSPRLSKWKLTLPPFLAKSLGISQKNEKEYSHLNSAIVGGLTFFLPCGFTQAMQLFAMSSGSFLKGALIMGIFALGTAPGLLGVGGLTSVIKGSAAKLFFRFVGVLVVILAIVNINTGFSLTGWQFFRSSNDPSPLNQTEEKNPSNNEVQVLNTTFLSNEEDILPNHFTVEVNRPVKFVVKVNENGVGCMNTIMIPGLVNKPVVLKKDKDVVFEFTPKKKGKYDIACAMGVKRGEITVK